MDLSTTHEASKPLALHEPLGPRARKRPPIVTLDGRDLAEVLHITPATVWNALSTNPGRLPPPIRIDGAGGALWLESTVLQWLQERQVHAKPHRGRPTKRQQIDRATSAAAREAMELEEPV